MRSIHIFLYEWKHFIHSPFKVLAILLFVLASIYGLQNGANLYHKQLSEVLKIQERIVSDRNEIIDNHYKTNRLIPDSSPWVNYGEPFWALWMSYPYHFKSPSASMVYSIGQAEQYGFYKRITFRATPYDADLAEEIANPERLQSGTLDFAFAIIYLMPLILLVLLYNIKSTESEQGFLSIIDIQIPSRNTWIFLRTAFYVVLLLSLTLGLVGLGAFLTPVWSEASSSIALITLYCLLYLVFWAFLFLIIIYNSESILGNTLKMTAIYLLFALIIPATVHQILSIRMPTNMMTDFIDVRDQKEALYDMEDDLVLAKLVETFPMIENSPVYADSTKINAARSDSYFPLINELNKASIVPIEEGNKSKNVFISQFFWVNPVSLIQNRFNKVARTHYDDYQMYRNEIQTLVDTQIQYLINDTWNGITVDLEKFTEYTELSIADE